MEEFLSSIVYCFPVTIEDIKLQPVSEKIASIRSLESITISSFSNESLCCLEMAYHCSNLHLLCLSLEDMQVFLSSLITVLETWRTCNEHHELEILSFEECETSGDTNDYLMSLFSSPYLATLQSFLFRPTSQALKESRLSNRQFLSWTYHLQLHAFSSLSSFLFPANRVSEKGIDSLCSLYEAHHLHRLSALDFSFNPIGSKGALQLSRLLRNTQYSLDLLYLRLMHAGMKGKGAERFLQGLGESIRPMLREISIDNAFPERAVKGFFLAVELKRFPQLQVLNFSGVKVTPTIAARIANSVRNGGLDLLDHLHLSKCGLHSVALQTLAYALIDHPLAQLRYLDLSENGMKKGDMRFIKRIMERGKLNSVEEIVLDGNKIELEGINALMEVDGDEVMKNCRIIRLNRCSLNHESIVLITNFIQSRKWKEVREIYLEDNPLTAMSVVHLRSLFQLFNSLQYVSIGEGYRWKRPEWHLKNMQYTALPSIEESLEEETIHQRVREREAKRNSLGLISPTV